MNLLLVILFLGAAAPQAGQADYSQQWAEYYRSMGMIKEAEAIEMRVGGLMVLHSNKRNTR